MSGFVASSFVPERVFQHAEEAAFLWQQRAACLRSRDRDLGNLEDLDERVDAHADGLAVAVAAGWSGRDVDLELSTAGDIFAYAVGRPSIEEVVQDLRDVVASTELVSGLGGVLSWRPWSEVASTISAWASGTDRVRRLIAIGAATVHRQKVRLATVSSEEASAVIRYAGLVRDPAAATTVVEGRRSVDEISQALLAEGLLSRQVRPQLLDHVRDHEPEMRAEMVDLAVRSYVSAGLPNLSWLEASRLFSGEKARIAAVAAVGDPAAIPWLFERLGGKETAREAARAFALITGADLDRDLLSGEPMGGSSGPNDDPEDEDVSIPEDADLRWPNSLAIERWWVEHAKKFRSGRRHLMGEVFRPETFVRAMALGYQDQRMAAAFELAYAGSEPVFPLEAPAWRQRRSLVPDDR